MSEIPFPTTIQIRFDYSQLGRAAEKIARRAADRIRGHQRAAVIEIGRELLAVKQHLKHGEFISWVEAECGFTRRTANNVMHVATRFSDKWEIVSHLPPTLLYELAAPSTPDDFLQRVLETPENQRLEPSSLKAQLQNRRHQKSKAERRRRSKEPTRGQIAYAKRQNKIKTQAQKRIDDARHAGRQKAEQAAKIICDALGDKLGQVLEVLRDASGFDLMEALRVHHG